MGLAADLKGKNIGPYRLIEEVGSGGLGRVYRAVDERNGNTVAVKILHEKFINNRKFLGIFHRELITLASTNHKHIVRYLDSCFEPPVCFIVTEFVEGWSLHAFLKLTGRVPPLVALCIIIDMLQAVDHLHLHDIVHSDLSAANVLLDRSGRVLVTDFGLACQIDVEDYKNYLVGTPGYYSPEHITDSAIVPPTDIYCAGLLLYELLTGKKAVPPLNDHRKVLQYMKNINFEIPFSSDRRMNKLLVRLLQKTLAFSVSRRVHGTDVMMFECYRILKYFNVRYARLAIKKFLVDRGLTKGPYQGEEQQIYTGFLT